MTNLKTFNLQLQIVLGSPRWKATRELVVRQIPANNLKITTNIADKSLKYTIFCLILACRIARHTNCSMKGFLHWAGFLKGYYSQET
jgi:hypothetical protein